MQQVPGMARARGIRGRHDISNSRWFRRPMSASVDLDPLLQYAEILKVL